MQTFGTPFGTQFGQRFGAVQAGEVTPPAPTAPTITTTSLADPIVGTAYSQSIVASGTATITYAVTVGALPTGLSLNADTGAITGTPSVEDTFAFTVTATNDEGNDTQEYTLKTWVIAAITNSTLAAMTEDAVYTDTVDVTGTAPITFAVQAGTLPAGLSLNASTGEISGTPTTAGAYDFTVRATNYAGFDDQQYTGSVASGATAPAAATGLTATPFSTARIDLVWTDNATDETGYLIYRSTNGSSYTEIDDIAADSEAYSDTTIDDGVTYYYKVAAYNIAGETDSNVAITNSLLLSAISWWKMEEASGTREDAIGSNDLADNATVTMQTGKVGNAAEMTFGNSEYLSIASNASLQTGDIDFTFAAWIYMNAVPATERWIASKGGSGWEWYVNYHSDKRIRFVIRNAETFFASTFGALSAATWYHITCWHDATSGQCGVSVNGTANTAARTTGPTANADPFRIGWSPVPGTTGFDGRIDEAVFWKRLLTADERAALYNSGNGLLTPFLA